MHIAALDDPEGEDEAAGRLSLRTLITTALRAGGHDVADVCVAIGVREVLETLARLKPDLVF